MIITVFFVILILLSPFVSYYLAGYAVDWATLSNVGQSYGVVATILSGAALIGVVTTVGLQRKQTRIIAEQALRQAHVELMREAWTDLTLLQALEIVPEGKRDLARQFAFVNAHFMYLRMGLLYGHVSAQEIEDAAAHAFSTPAGDFYWRRMEEQLRRYFEPEFVAALSQGGRRAQNRPEGHFIDVDSPELKE